MLYRAAFCSSPRRERPVPHVVTPLSVPEKTESVMAPSTRPLAIVTGASAGIGYELAKQCAEHGYDLVIAADEPAIHTAARDFRSLGAEVEAVETDLATLQGVDTLYAALHGHPV